MGLKEFIEFYRPGYNQAVERMRLMETPLPPELGYAYSKVVNFPGGAPNTDIGPPHALDNPSWGPPPATIGELMARVGPLKAMEELMPKPPAKPEWKVAGNRAVRLPPPGSFEQPEFAMPPPEPETSVYEDAEKIPWLLSRGGGTPPSAVRFPGEFPTTEGEGFEPPYAGPEGSLLQRSRKTGKVSPVLGRRGEGGGAADTQEFRDAKEAADFVIKFVPNMNPTTAMLLSMNPKLMNDPAFRANISGAVPSHLRPVYNQMVKRLEKYWKVEGGGKTFTYDREKGLVPED